MTRTLLAFSVADLRLGLDADSVQEVVPSARLVTPPEMPPLMRGFLALGSRLIPVIHLEKLLQGGNAVPISTMKLSDRIVIARLQGTAVAWLAEGQMEPLVYRTRDMMPLPEDHVLNNCAAFVLPQTPPVVLLEPDRLLMEAELLRLDQLRQMAAERQALLEVEQTAAA